jgi:hypothetical protein
MSSYDEAGTTTPSSSFDFGGGGGGDGNGYSGPTYDEAGTDNYYSSIK